MEAAVNIKVAISVMFLVPLFTLLLQVDRSQQSSSRQVVVDYKVSFEWVYTGTPNMYREYSGQVTFAADREEGLPIHATLPDSTVIHFERIDGKPCRFHIGPRDGAVFCPAPEARPREFYPLATTIVKNSKNHYIVFAVPSELKSL